MLQSVISWAIILIAVAATGRWLYRHIRREGKDGCGNCPASDTCTRRNGKREV